MIVKLTKEQIVILTFTISLYSDRVYEQNMRIPTNMKHSAEVIKEIVGAFNTATEE